MLSRIKETLDNHRKLITVAGAGGVVVAAALFGAYLIRRELSWSMTDECDDDGGHDGSVGAAVTNARGGDLSQQVALADLPLAFQQQLLEVVLSYERRIAALVAARQKSKKSKRVSFAVPAAAAATSAGTHHQQHDETTPDFPQNNDDTVLLAVDSRFHRCVAVLLPEHQPTAASIKQLTSSGADVAVKASCSYPAVLKAPWIQFHLIPRRIFVGVPPLTISFHCRHRNNNSSYPNNNNSSNIGDDNDDGGERVVANPHAQVTTDQNPKHEYEYEDDEEDDEEELIHFEESISADFTILEPPLASVLASHGLHQSRWRLSIAYFLRFPNSAICRATFDRDAATCVARSSVHPTAASPSSPLTVANVNSACKPPSSQQSSRLSSSATSVAASHFFAMPSLVLSPEQELDRHLGTNTVFAVPTRSPSLPQQPPPSPQPEIILRPASMRINERLPGILRDCIVSFVQEHAVTLAGAKCNNNGSNNRGGILEARQLAASYERMISERLMYLLPDRLYRECGIRVSDVAAVRVQLNK